MSSLRTFFKLSIFSKRTKIVIYWKFVHRTYAGTVVLFFTKVSFFFLRMKEVSPRRIVIHAWEKWETMREWEVRTAGRSLHPLNTYLVSTHESNNALWRTLFDFRMLPQSVVLNFLVDNFIHSKSIILFIKTIPDAVVKKARRSQRGPPLPTSRSQTTAAAVTATTKPPPLLRKGHCFLLERSARARPRNRRAAGGFQWRRVLRRLLLRTYILYSTGCQQ